MGTTSRMLRPMPRGAWTILKWTGKREREREKERERERESVCVCMLGGGGGGKEKWVEGREGTL